MLRQPEGEIPGQQTGRLHEAMRFGERIEIHRHSCMILARIQNLAYACRVYLRTGGLICSMTEAKLKRYSVRSGCQAFENRRKSILAKFSGLNFSR